MTRLTMTTVSLILIFIILPINHFQLSFSQSLVTTLPGFPGKLPFKLQTGYVGLGENEDLQLFYYFLESERNPSDDPLIIWITGGPGCSALRAICYQLGPLKFDYANSQPPGTLPQLKYNPYTWTKVANIIFIDASGAGFSYAKTYDAYKTSDTLSSASIYEFLRKWLLNNPQFLSNPLYIAGISYSGILVPVITQDIYNGNEAGNYPRLNIQGYISGNPLTDRDIDFNARIPYAYQFALLSDELFEATKTHCNGEYVNVDPANGLCQNSLAEVNECIKNVNVHQILEPICASEMQSKRMLRQGDINSITTNPASPHRLSQFGLPENWCREENYLYATTWASDKTVQKALHIREGTIKEWLMCNDDHYAQDRPDTDTYKYDITSTIPYHRNLTKKNCRALIYNGDHDMVFSYVGTRKWIRTLGMKVDRTWTPWLVRNQVSGYTETYSHANYTLTYATVKGAGHSAPEFKPEESLAMLERWLGHTHV